MQRSPLPFKVPAQPGSNSEKQVFGVEKILEDPHDRWKIAENDRQNSIDSVKTYMLDFHDFLAVVINNFHPPRSFSVTGLIIVVAILIYGLFNKRRGPK